MAKALWEQPITKNDDWGGGDFSGGAPVSGKYVQEFIKDTLNKKFGYLYYNKSAGQGKYYVFADQDDYNKWFVNQSLNADLVLATFDAPAPATIKTTVKSPESVTMLFGADITPLVFHYYIADNSGNAVSGEDVIMRITATSKSSVKSEVITIPFEASTYKLKESEYATKFPEDGYDPSSTDPIGTRYVYTRLNRLLTTAENYSIVVTLTGATTQVSTTLSFEYKLVELKLSSDFNYLSPINYNTKEFTQKLNISGAEGFAKIFVLKIDGKPFIQDPEALGIHESRILSSGDSLGDSANINNKQLEIFMTDKDNNPVRWSDTGEEVFTPGRHTLQLYTYINYGTSEDEKIISKILYFNFVIADASLEQTYLMYKSELQTEYQEGEKIKLEGTQYSQIEYSVGVYDSRDRNVPIKYIYTVPVFDKDGNPVIENGQPKTKVVDEITHSVSSGSVDDVKYTLRESGTISLTVSAYSSNDILLDKLEIEIESKDSGIKIGEITDNNLFKFYAENRSIYDPDRELWPNTSVTFGSQYTQAGVLNKVNFNELNGWDGKSLILRNGATVTFPFNLFNLPSGDKLEESGFTFEIDFETMNVQDDDAMIMDFSDKNTDGDLNYNSYIRIKATNAELSTKNGTKIKTNFKEAERIKIAFIVNPLQTLVNNQFDPNNLESDQNPNTLFIMVNGVLDRVVKYGTGRVGSDGFIWNSPISSNGSSFTIGNTDGKAAVKIYSIRIYNKALTLDEEFMNYMNDQSGEKLIKVFDDNNVIEDNKLSFNKIKELIPTMLMGIDYQSYGSFTALEKKANTFAEVQFFMPPTEDKNMNFYARQCWVSCQGTSSMSYPVKNLRLYFCKGWTKSKTIDGVTNLGTFQYVHSLQHIGETAFDTSWDDTRVTVPVYETEFWPYSEYKSDAILIGSTAMDEKVPYGTNKKVDGPDGSRFRVGDGMDDLSKGTEYNAIHDGYHMIGANRTIPGRVALLRTYLGLTELDPTKINAETLEIETKPLTLYWVKPGTQPIVIKDAFDDTHEVFSTSGMDGRLKLGTDASGNEIWSEYRTDIDEKGPDGKPLNETITHDAFTSKYDDNKTLAQYLNELTDAELEKFFEGNDVFISAYRPLLRTDETLGSDSYKTYLDELRYSGVKLFFWNGKKFKNNKEQIDYNQLYYSLGANWRQYDDHNNEHGYGKTHISGWTDRWTLKADYAESSMTHNGGVGRLWGNAMYNVTIDNKNKCRTEAQNFVNGTIDIRTSCDGRPIVLFYKQIIGFNEATGLPVYSDDIKYAGLYNIMTDKSSTKLFGFEDISNPAGKKWKANNTECWECLNNGSDIIKGLSTAFDAKDSNGKTLSGEGTKPGKLGESRPLWGTYESRWPDTGQERHEYNPVTNPLGNNWGDDVYGVDTKNLEAFLRWVNFTKDAVDYKIGAKGEMNGYVQNIYIPLDNIEAQRIHNLYDAAKSIYESETSTKDEKAEAAADMEKYLLYRQWDKSGNTVYSPLGGTWEVTKPVDGKDTIVEETVTWALNENIVWYLYNHDINMEIVTKTVNTEKIGHKVYVVPIPSFDAQFRCNDSEGNPDTLEQLKYYVDTYVWSDGSGTYEYYDNYGELQQKVTAAKINLDVDNEHKVSLGEGLAPVSCSGITYMQYFSATKREHLDLEKVAAYYIYLLRFGAVDQVVKNSMMTTEDGKHYYFINYDNDTILGVRNDGYLIYNWDIDRNSFDASLPGYSFAGSQSVLWNNLEMDEEFMALVQTIDNAMNEQGLLSADAVLTWLNERQEASWCERLYNEQEKVKYLSTVKKDFTTDKYLGFMHGTRHSHRNWWVNHRWELYDAKWSSGMYSKKQMSFIYTLQASSNSPKDMMIVTAASKYYFTLIRNTQMAYKDWFKELGREESGVFTIRQSNSVGDPIFFYGPQKLKVLNLRPNASAISRISLAEPYDITLVDGTKKTSNWVDDDGALMTKLLIGFDDTKTSSTAVDISGLDKLYSLEEVDIRGMKNLNGAVPVISGLVNLHRWRAKNSNATTFIPAKGVTLYEVSLGTDTTAITLDNVEFIKDSNAYVEYQKDVVSGDDNVGSNLGKLYGDILPEYTKLSAYKYCKTYDEETNTLVAKFSNILDESNNPTNEYTGEYVFDYEPNEKLTDVIFNNVKGIDTYQFLMDLKAAYIKAGKATSTCNVNLSGIEWVLEDDEDYDINAETQTPRIDSTIPQSAVDKLLSIYNTFNYKNSEGKEQFGGKVFIKKAEGVTLSQKEYSILIETFGEDVFKPSNTLVINCAEGILMNVVGGETTVELIGNNYETVYNLVQGNELKVIASIFPISTTNKFVYVLEAWNNSPAITHSGAQGAEVYTMSSGAYTFATLTNKDSEATLVFNPIETTVGLENGQYFRVVVCNYKNNGEPDTNHPQATVYVKSVKRIMATEAQVEIYDYTDNANPVKVSLDGESPKSEIKDSLDHLFVIKYNQNVKPNVDVKSVEVSFNKDNSQYTFVRTNTNNETNVAAEFKTFENGQYVNIDNKLQEYKFIIKHNIAQFIDERNLTVYIKITLENGTVYEKTLSYDVICYYATQFNIYSNNAIVPEIKITDIGTYEYDLVISNESGNETNINYTFEITDEPNINGCTTSIENGKLKVIVNTTKTSNESKVIEITATPDVYVENYITDLVVSKDFKVLVSYPDFIEIECKHLELNNNNPQKVQSNIRNYNDAFNITLTDGLAIGEGAVLPGKLEFKCASTSGEVTMSYAIEGLTISVGEVTKSFHGEDTLEFSDTTGGTISFFPVLEDVTLDGNIYKSLKYVNFTTNGLSGANSETTIKITCKLRYDNDKNTVAEGESPYFVFYKAGSLETTEEVEFTMNMSRSKCFATTYQRLLDIDQIENQYTLYAVDKQNRFFEVDAILDNDGNLTSITHSFNENDVAKYAGNIEGLGFVIHENSTPHPIFVSFKQWIGYGVGNNSSASEYSLGKLNGNSEETSLRLFASNNTLYNGAKITQYFVEEGSHVDSIFDRVYNSDSSIKLYVPSYAELSMIVNTTEIDGEVVSIPSKQTLIINQVMKQLLQEGYAMESRNYNAANNYNYNTTDNSIIGNLLDVKTNMKVLGNYTLANMRYITSTNVWNTSVGANNQQVLTVRAINCTDSQGTYSITSIEAPRNDNDNFRNIVIPFVNVK